VASYRPATGRDVMEQVVAIVLGGGRGTRLYPLTALRIE
jgi:ADP-glucose pyrophosphorylase